MLEILDLTLPGDCNLRALGSHLVVACGVTFLVPLHLTILVKMNSFYMMKAMDAIIVLCTHRPMMIDML